MKNKTFFYALICAFLAFLWTILLLPNLSFANAATQSKAECVMEVSSRRILSSYNEEEELPLASTTKILTAIMIIEDCNLDDEVQIPYLAQGVEGSSVYLRAGEVFSVRDLLYGLMLRSGNDCAVTLAIHHSQTIENFAQKMNEKAFLLGAEHSHFINPHGLSNENHYTTARDLALIASYAMENETFQTIVSTKFYEPRGWKNKNKMLWQYEGAMGVKTGFTLRAGRCLVTGAKRDGMTVVCVVLNSPQMYERTVELLNDAFENYQMTKLIDDTQRRRGYFLLKSFSYPLKEEEKGQLTMKVKLYRERQKERDFVGQIEIYLEKNLIFSQNLYMIEK